MWFGLVWQNYVQLHICMYEVVNSILYDYDIFRDILLM